MRIKNNITKTLERSLFSIPNPPKFKKEYQELFDFIFPNKEIFILFLEEENFEQQTFYAEKILLRLSYDSIFAPPTRYLFNTLAMESEIFGEKKHGHIGRDHFVHLVHLYLLGIYSFFYHSILNENIFIHFRNIRSISKVTSNHLSQSIIKDFIVSWRYFVLFHDISYPIEYFLGDSNINNDRKKRFLRAFNNNQKFIGKDLSLRSLSKFISVFKLIKNKSDINLKKLITEEISKDKLTEFGDIKLNEYKQLEKIYGFETIRIVYSVFGKEKIIPVLFDENMYPILVYKYDNLNGLHKPLETKHFKKDNVVITKILNSQGDAPFLKECINNKKYNWGYFIDSKFTLDILLRKFFKDITFEEFDKTIEYIHELTASQYAMIVSDSSFKQYCFDIYFVLYKLSGYFNSEDNTSQDNYTKYLSDVIQDFGQDIPIRISEILKKLLQEKNENIDFEEDMDSRASLDIVILDYFKNISKTYKGFASEIANQLRSSIELQYKTKKNLRKIRDSVGNLFIQDNITDKLIVNTDTDSLDKTELIVITNNNLKNIIKAIDIKAKKSQIGTFNELIEYKPKFKNIREKFFDHGVSSCLVFLSLIDTYKQLKTIPENTFNLLLKVSLGIDIDKESNYIDYKMDSIFSETCFAILTHNIYPEFLNKTNKNYRTKIDRNPFAYFCILMDSLQQWDRKFQINQVYNELPYNTLSKGFNIEIKNNKFRITEFNSQLDLKKSLMNLKLGIDDYLEKASELIELNLAEY